MPAICVSSHAEMVHCFFYIIYSPQLGVIPQGRQAREQYPETDSFELSLTSSNSNCISMVPIQYIYNKISHLVGLYKGHQTGRSWSDSVAPFHMSCLGQYLKLLRAPPHYLWRHSLRSLQHTGKAWFSQCLVPSAQVGRKRILLFCTLAGPEFLYGKQVGMGAEGTCLSVTFCLASALFWYCIFIWWEGSLPRGKFPSPSKLLWHNH